MEATGCYSPHDINTYINSQFLFQLQISKQFILWTFIESLQGRRVKAESLWWRQSDAESQMSRCESPHITSTLFSPFSALFICLLFDLSLHHVLPLFLLHLFVVILSVAAGQLICRKVKPTLHSQHASWSESVSWTVDTLSQTVCFHVSSSQWSHRFSSQSVQPRLLLFWSLWRRHPKVCWRTETWIMNQDTWRSGALSSVFRMIRHEWTALCKMSLNVSNEGM